MPTRAGFLPSAVLILSLFAWVPAAAQEPLTPHQWRADLDELTAHVLENHRNPFHTVPEEDFREAVGSLSTSLDSLSGDAIAAEFARLLAMVGDGHTRLTLPANVHNLGYVQAHTPDPDPRPGAPRFSTLPVRFMEFEEGVHIVAATAPAQSLLGHRVLSIGGTPVEDARAAMSPFVAHDSQAGLRFHTVKLLAIPELLARASVEGGRDGVVLEVTPPGAPEGTPPSTMLLTPVPYGQSPAWEEAGMGLLPSADPEGPYYELEDLPGGELLVRIHQINDHPSEPIGAFSARLNRVLEERDPERVVLDLRYCHGGDQSLSRALVLPFIRWPGAQAPGRLFALVGPETFSAAVNLASRLEEWTQVTFVGEPLGSGPSHYSSSDREVLDESGLVVRVSTGYFVGWTGSEWRESVEIGLPVRATIEEFLAGEDVPLAAALAHEPGVTPAQQLESAFDSGGINAALIAWSRFRTDPATADDAGPDLGNQLAAYLLEKGETRFAAGIYLFNREFHPASVDAYLGEARAHLESGDRDQAIAALEAGLEAAPGNRRLARMLANVREGGS